VAVAGESLASAAADNSAHCLARPDKGHNVGNEAMYSVKLGAGTTNGPAGTRNGFLVSPILLRHGYDPSQGVSVNNQMMDYQVDEHDLMH
jgi:hypothetical protein